MQQSVPAAASAGRQPPPVNNPAPVKIYNAVYSSVQVYECMVRGIAVMRRRADSFVNATQILKVAGVDKGRRTKILEKEILPGKHEIVQGGYGKYQGTWIPLERGRDIANQYGVLPLLAPLFDFTPSTNSLQALPMSTPSISGVTSRPLSAASSYGSYLPGVLAPPPIMPGSALRLLNQGRAQGLFTPSTSAAHISGGSNRFSQVSPAPGPSHSPFSPASAASTPPPALTSTNFLKRPRSNPLDSAQPTAGASTHSFTGDVRMIDPSDEGPSPAKRARKESTPPNVTTTTAAPSGTRPSSSTSTAHPVLDHLVRYASKPSFPRNIDPSAPLKDTRRAAVIASISQSDDPMSILNLLREIATFPANSNGVRNTVHATAAANNNNRRVIDVDTILDEQGHNALHLATSLSRVSTVQALIAQGADVYRGNHLGETPLMRTILSTHSYNTQSLPTLLQSGLSQTILTLDTSRKSVLHHIVSLAGVKGRAVVARYYLDQIFYWIATKMAGDFGSIIDLQDEHGDTALNIAARVGSRTLVRTLIDVGANKTLMNKLGLRPGDFGVESEELAVGFKAEDIMQMYRPTTAIPIQKSQDVIADMTALIQTLASDFQSEIKVKQDSLDVTQAHLRAATRELAEQRKQIQLWQGRCRETEVVEGRKRNLEKAIKNLDTAGKIGGGSDTGIGRAGAGGEGDMQWEKGLGSFDWTGRLGPGENVKIGVALRKSVAPLNSGSTRVPPSSSSTGAVGTAPGIGTPLLSKDKNREDDGRSIPIKTTEDDEMDVDADASADDDDEAEGTLARPLPVQDLVPMDTSTSSTVVPTTSESGATASPSAVSSASNSALTTTTTVPEVISTVAGVSGGALSSISSESLSQTASSSTGPVLVSPAFRYRGSASSLVGAPPTSSISSSTSMPPATFAQTQISSPVTAQALLSLEDMDPDPPLPTSNDVQTLIRLRRMKLWSLRLEELLMDKLEGMKGASAEKEYMCRRIVSLCTGVEVGSVDGMLDNLVIAMESEANIVDIGRVSGFMQKVRDGII